jgi:uncharacterized membrane protein YhhN
MDRRFTLPNLVLAASVVAGVSYIASWQLDLSQAASLTWKGLGVGLLAVYAALRAKDLNGWLIAAVMALGCAGDVLLGIQFIVGAVAFLIGHAVAIVLYLRSRRQVIQRSQLALAVLLVPATVFIAFMLPADRDGAPGVAFYTLGLSLMAATAWTSRFPRFTVGIGALLFLVSDLVIFAKMGPWPETFLTGLAVWVPYYGGQLLICVGAVGAIEHWRDTAARERVTGG